MSLIRKRERFERSDVPTPSPVRTAVSAVVLLVFAVCIYMVVTTLWQRAHQVDGFRDRSYRSALRSQAAPSGPGEGFAASDSKLTNTLIFLTAADGSLTQAQLLSYNDSSQTWTIASIPLTTKLVTTDGTFQLVAYYAAQGATACIAPLAASSNQAFTHMISATDTFWEQLGQLRGPEILVLVGSSADILETITSDLSTKEFLSLTNTLQTMEPAALRRIDVPVIPEQLEDGTVFSIIDQTALGVELGALVQLAPAPVEEPAEEEESSDYEDEYDYDYDYDYA